MDIAIICPMEPLCRGVIGIQPFDNNIKYRFLRYVVTHTVSEGTLCLNLLTRELILVSEFRGDFSTADNSIREYLVNHFFLVPYDNDDFLIYRQLLSFHSAFNKKGYDDFTVVTTTDCNARCFYCYEAGCEKKIMSSDVAISAAQFITKCASESGRKASIHWFGGEPLYNSAAIDLISERLNSNNIPFTSSTISNCYLFDQRLILRAVNCWHLKKVQVTLDGTESEYNRIKNYIYTGNAYERVLSNIEMLANAGINVSIRLNFNDYNINDIEALLSELILRFKDNANIKVYPKLLFEGIAGVSPYTPDERKHLYQKLLSFEEILKKNGLFSVAPWSNTWKSFDCMAANPNSIVVFPDGMLSKCENLMRTDFCGTLFSGITNPKAISDVSKRKYDPLCGGCPLVPHCIKLDRCPTQVVDCHIDEQNYRVHRIKEKMVAALQLYNKYKVK